MNSNFSKKSGTTAIVLLITVCLIPAMAWAFGPGDGRSPDEGFAGRSHHRSALGIWQDPKLIQKLELTEEQVRQLRDADFNFREKQLILKAQLGSLHLQLDKAFSDDIVDNAAVLQLAKKISDIKGTMFIQDIESRLAIGKFLNPDQIHKLRLNDMHRGTRSPERGEKPLAGPHRMGSPDDRNPFEN